MRGSAGVMALVLAEAVAGASVFLWVLPLWSEVRHGFFKLVGSILVVLGATTWFAARAAEIPGDGPGSWATGVAVATTLLLLATTALLFARREIPARVLGLLSAAVAIALLVPMALAGTEHLATSMFQLLAGAGLLGSVTIGLLLGHWYLTDRKLSRRPISRATTIMLASIVVAAVATVAGGFEATGDTNTINPLLTTAGLAPWIALGMVASTLLIGILVKATLRGERASAVQSATGFFYLAVVTAFTAEVAVKTRFLG